MELVSIILPVYNAEKYLEKCVKSILNQTYQNIELIMVNDGSKDNSLAICQKLEKEDKRIRFFNKENGGCSTARNMGIDNARGEFLTFIDPDDCMLSHHIECLVKATENADMGIVDFLRTKPKDSYKENSEKELSRTGEFVEKKEFIKGIFSFPSFGGGVVWNKLFRKSIIGDLRFDENCYYFDDLNFLFKYVLRCKTFYYLPIKTYMYVVNPNSNSAKNLSQRKLTCLYGMNEVVKLAETVDKDIASYAKAWQFLVNIEMRWLIHLNKFKDEKIKNEINETLKSTYKDFKKNKKNFHSFRKFGGLAYRMMQTFNY